MKIVSNARKLILRPAVGAPTVTFPEGAIVNPYGAGNDTPSVVVQNGTCKENSWQGVSHETGAVIINGVPGDVAALALAQYSAGGQTIEVLNRVLTDLSDLGFNDQYTTPLHFIETKLSPAGDMLDNYTGMVKRDDRDLVDCWREGNVFYVFTDGKREIEGDILVRDYRLPDGTAIDLNQISEDSPQAMTATT